MTRAPGPLAEAVRCWHCALQHCGHPGSRHQGCSPSVPLLPSAEVWCLNPQRKPGEGFLFFFFFPFCSALPPPRAEQRTLVLRAQPCVSGASRHCQRWEQHGDPPRPRHICLWLHRGRFFSPKRSGRLLLLTFFLRTLKVNSGDARLAASARILPQQEDPCSAAILSLLLLQTCSEPPNLPAVFSSAPYPSPR